MATTTCMKRLIWSTAMLAALTARPATAEAQTTTQPEREVVELAARQEPGAIERAARVRFDFGRERSEIGVSVRDVEDAADDAADDAAAGPAADEGAVVTDVRADGPAEAGGIEPGDVVVEFDGERVRSARQLARLVEETPAGRATPVRVLRDGSTVALSVTPAETSGWTGRLPRLYAGRVRSTLDEIEDRVESEELAVLRRLPEVFRDFVAPWRPGRVRLGIHAQSLGGQLAAYFGTSAGVLVEHVDDDTVGAAAGLRAGDVITAIDGEAVDDIGALRRRLARLEPDAAFDITIVRDRAQTSLTAEPAPEEEEEEEEEDESPRPRPRGPRI